MGWPGTGPGPGSALQALRARRQVSPGVQASPACPRLSSEVPLDSGGPGPFPTAAFPDRSRLRRACRGLCACRGCRLGLELRVPCPDGAPQLSMSGARELCLTPEPPSHFLQLLPVPCHGRAVPTPHCLLCWDREPGSPKRTSSGASRWASGQEAAAARSPESRVLFIHSFIRSFSSQSAHQDAASVQPGGGEGGQGARWPSGASHGRPPLPDLGLLVHRVTNQWG